MIYLELFMLAIVTGILSTLLGFEGFIGYVPLLTQFHPIPLQSALGTSSMFSVDTSFGVASGALREPVGI